MFHEALLERIAKEIGRCQVLDVLRERRPEGILDLRKTVLNIVMAEGNFLFWS